MSASASPPRGAAAFGVAPSMWRPQGDPGHGARENDLAGARAQASLPALAAFMGGLMFAAGVFALLQLAKML